tara:strand:+ start:324 stop:698 length:375 start_codon:yes stop_codon:yes gene_type:complete
MSLLLKNNNYDFKKLNNFDTRLKESERIKSKYPNRIPIIVSKDARCKDVPDLDRHKYLVPTDLTVGQFMYVIRKRINLTPEKSIYLFTNGTLPNSSKLLTEIYENNQDDDGFLYITYTGESTFG